MVKARDHVKLLGVLLDQHLTFKKHFEHIKKKTTKQLQVITVLGGYNWGLLLKEFWIIYNACIALVALYVVSVWYMPKAWGQLALYREQVKVLIAI